MDAEQTDSLLYVQHLRKVAALQTYHGASDRELLERFVGAHDEAAFTVLIERHGPMVLGVCRRALPNFYDAEDACQATFLVLARKASSVRRKTSLSSWLHGVARRVAAKLTREYARRKSRERRVDAPAAKDPAAEISWREVQAILDEELEQLPERYRAPVILCYLQCLTREDAGKQLGLSPGSLHGRLERGRDLLRERLTKRGLTLSAAMSAAALGESLAQAALAPTLAVSSTKAALLLSAGQPLTPSLVPTHVLALTQEVLITMFLTKLKLGTGVALCAGLLAALIGSSFGSLGIAQDAKPPLVVKDSQFVAQDAKPEPLKGQTESDTDFIRRISKDLRGYGPSTTEIDFFVASQHAGKRQKLIDLFIQDRQAQKEAAARQAVYNRALGHATVWMDNETHSKLGPLQKEFYKALNAATEKGDVAKVTQAHLERMIEFLKASPKSNKAPEAMRQIVWAYEFQGKMVQASAWRDKLKDHPKASGKDPLHYYPDEKQRELKKQLQDFENELRKKWEKESDSTKAHLLQSGLEHYQARVATMEEELRKLEKAWKEKGMK